MRTISPLKVGLTFGVTLAVLHLMWAALVAFGWAQPVLDFLFWVHFITPVYAVGPFEPAVAALLVAITAATGFAMGLIFGLIWNSMQRAKTAGFQRG